MSNLGQTLAGWAEARISDLQLAPRMWGSTEAVERQVDQLRELLELIRSAEGMNALRDRVVAWAQDRMEQMLASGRASEWGSDEAVEMQALQFLEVWALALQPRQGLDNPRLVIDAYSAFLRAQFPSQTPEPLYRLAPSELGRVLREFRAKLGLIILVEEQVKQTAPEVERPSTSGPEASYVENLGDEALRDRADAHSDRERGIS